MLELFREGVISFEQAAPLQDLMVRWTGDDKTQIEVSDEFDIDPDPQALDAGESKVGSEEAVPVDDDNDRETQEESQ